MKIIYLDECGYTGEDLFNKEQPFFTLSSLDLDEEICCELKAKHFNKVQAVELKHKNLSKRPKQQKMIIELIKDLGANYPDSIKFVVAHKRYVLVTKIVDLLVETVAYDEGFDLYKNGENIAFSNILFHLIRKLTSEDFFDNILYNFQEMIRKRTIESYYRFFKPFFTYDFPNELNEFVWIIKEYHLRFGFSQLQNLPRFWLDIALSETLILMNDWKDSTPKSNNMVLIHDRSSTMSKEKEFWDRLVSPDSEAKIVGYDRRKMSYPIRIERTEFENSKEFVGLQIADILSGAISRYFKWIIEGKDKNDEYGKNLDFNMPLSFGGRMIWPSLAVTPQELGTIGADADNPIDYMWGDKNQPF